MQNEVFTKSVGKHARFESGLLHSIQNAECRNCLRRDLGSSASASVAAAFSPSRGGDTTAPAPFELTSVRVVCQPCPLVLLCGLVVSSMIRSMFCVLVVSANSPSVAASEHIPVQSPFLTATQSCQMLLRCGSSPSCPGLFACGCLCLVGPRGEGGHLWRGAEAAHRVCSGG